MRETIYFFDMFSDYEPPEDMHSSFSQAAVVSANVNAISRLVDVYIESPRYIPQRLLNRAQLEIRKLYDLRDIRILARHPQDQLHQVEPEELMAIFVNYNSIYSTNFFTYSSISLI